MSEPKEKQKDYWRRPENRARRNKRNLARWNRLPVETRQSLSRRTYLKHHYGLSPEDYERMRLGQNGQCAICKTSPPIPRGHHYALAVDHDHRTGKIRGLLCHNCNIALTFLERFDWEQDARLYLKRNAPE